MTPRKHKGQLTRVEDETKLPLIYKAAELRLGGMYIYEIALELNTSEKTIQRYLQDADELFKEAALADQGVHLGRALAKRLRFARSLSEIEAALCVRGKDGRLVGITPKIANAIVNTIRAQMANEDAVEELTGVKKAGVALAVGIGVQWVHVTDAHGIERRIPIGQDGRATGPPEIVGGVVEGEVIEGEVVEEGIVEVEEEATDD